MVSAGHFGPRGQAGGYAGRAVDQGVGHDVFECVGFL